MPMRAPLSWLREYIDINVPVEELARRLTLAGQEVEHIVRIGAEWENIYTGVVARLERHPNADRLNLATVEYGAGKAITVVTGAPNIEQGQKVVLGLVGCKYLDQHVEPPKWSTLKPAKIRGIQTEGMVMSEAELGLSEEHEGIIVLDPQTPLGLTAQEVLGDTVLEIDVTPNNGRILSMIGIAREIAALFGGEVRYPTIEWHAEGPPAQQMLSVEIHDSDLCARYSGAVIQNVKIGPSPAWMQRRLALAGMRPINNIVDITNYVMLEMGQPLHAFDYEAVEGRKIIVRRAREREQIETLDHVHRTLDPNMLAICDINKPVALAGVMGGANSEIGTEGTATVLLESAHFNPRTVRRTARLLKLPSEASYRFERWVDPTLTVPAMKRAAELMRQLGGGTIAEGYADEYPRPPKPRRIHFYTDEVERLLGIPLPPSEIARMLERLEFKVDLPHNADAVGKYTTMLIDVPSYRNDVTIPADVVEEVARMVGYDIIPETMLEGRLPRPEVNHSRESAEDISDMMLAFGMDEVLTYSVTHSESLRRLAALEESIGSQGAEGAEERPRYRAWDAARPPVTIVNPTSSRQDVMRPTMLSNMLDTLLMNMRLMPEAPVRIFELGKIFVTRTEQEVEQRRAEIERERAQYPRLRNWQPVQGEERLPLELRRLTGLMSGPREPRSLFVQAGGVASQPWHGEELDFFDAKGVVEEMLRHLHLQGVEWVPADAPLFHPGRVAMLRAGGRDLGVVGELHPAVLAEWDIPARRVAAWDLDVDALVESVPERHMYNQISPYVPVRQDMAFVVPADMAASRLAGAIKRAGGASVLDVTLFDIYTGQQVAEGQKSMAFAVTFNSTEKLLTEEEVARVRQRIARTLERELGAKLRG
ncbi:MAG: phenylalanine--tRNA ligase subunit beta [Chloroflexota bacterium]|nr:phenylalanine--tRNA ligase subunit beta [Chloroflexota bacterium]MDQ5866966.1 phenylalanine--tRNA ligase subunit beta [Chloroflexota bacterium]